jgi:hypothetical protein
MPEWVKWVAQDSSGAWWGYSVEPLRHDAGWYENEVGKCVRLGETRPDYWALSLCPIRQGLAEVGGDWGCDRKNQIRTKGYGVISVCGRLLKIFNL